MPKRSRSPSGDGPTTRRARTVQLENYALTSQIARVSAHNTQLRRILDILTSTIRPAVEVHASPLRKIPPLSKLITSLLSTHDTSIEALQRGEVLNPDAFRALRHACLDMWKDHNLKHAQAFADAMQQIDKKVWQYMPGALAAWNVHEGRLDVENGTVMCGIQLTNVPVDEAQCMPCCGAYYATQALNEAVRHKKTCPGCRAPLCVLFTPKSELRAAHWLRPFGMH